MIMSFIIYIYREAVAVFKISGLDEMQMELQTAAEAFESLNGEFATVKFDADAPSSIDAAITEAERAIDAKLTPFRGNQMVEAIADDLKANFRQEIYRRAAEARVQGNGEHLSVDKIEPSILRQIENTVTDLRAAEYNTFDRYTKKLSHLLHSPELEPITSKLTDDIDLESWIDAGLASQGGMLGTATLNWPHEPEKELGTNILLIDRFAEKEAALNFAHTFYYAGSRVTDSLQRMASEMIVPFARDYIAHVKSVTGVSEASPSPTPSRPATRKVFIVHGHEGEPREAVSGFLRKIDFIPVILHEQSNQGRTIVEKFEAHAEVDFAVVLLTPDDVGGSKGGVQQPRARQNVILELGYFIGKLGRQNVCAIKLGDDLEMPSDIIGVVWTPFDAHGAWKSALARELEDAGHAIDWNKAMRP
jgi:predicted nucleotide-binding protein